jgi:hypothetical protein
MYLMDDIVAAAVEIKDPRDPVLRIYGSMQARLQGTPRFLLDDAAIATAVELTLGRPKVLFDAMMHCRVPYPAMWVEWLESGREQLRRTFGGGPEYLVTKDRPLPTRLGFLIEADKETGRRGRVTWAWNSGSHIELNGVNFPNIGAISPYFDLDNQTPQSADRIKGFLNGNLAKLWQDNPTQLEGLFSIWRTADHRPSNWGASYLDIIHQRGGESALRKSLENMYADVYGEYIIVWGVLLMLTSSRRIVEYKTIDNSKLNRARAKRRQVPLLDHTKVVMRTDKLWVQGQRGQPLGYQRKSPRIHMVSSYLSHRGNKHWVVMPFWRGSGPTIHREVRVKG